MWVKMSIFRMGAGYNMAEAAAANDRRQMRVGARQAFVTASAIVALGTSLPLYGQSGPQATFDRAVADFEAGRVTEAAEGFDRVARLLPDQAPQLWQRGIALYYAGRYKDCRAQFESHRTVNPDDVENAAWHFACVARAESADKAKAALLPVGPDSRRPMREIYQMFQGRMTPQQVLSAA